MTSLTTSAKGGDANRVLRGGSWVNDPNVAAAVLRNCYDPDDRYDYDGFRVVLGVASPIP